MIRLVSKTVGLDRGGVVTISRGKRRWEGVFRAYCLIKNETDADVVVSDVTVYMSWDGTGYAAVGNSRATLEPNAMSEFRCISGYIPCDPKEPPPIDKVTAHVNSSEVILYERFPMVRIPDVPEVLKATEAPAAASVPEPAPEPVKSVSSRVAAAREQLSGFTTEDPAPAKPLLTDVPAPQIQPVAIETGSQNVESVTSTASTDGVARMLKDVGDKERAIVVGDSAEDSE